MVKVYFTPFPIDYFISPMNSSSFVKIGLSYGKTPSDVLESLARQGIKQPEFTVCFVSSELDQKQCIKEIKQSLKGHLWGLSSAGEFNGIQEEMTCGGIFLLSIEPLGDVLVSNVAIGKIEEKAEKTAKEIVKTAFEGLKFSPELLYLGFSGKKPSEMLKVNPFSLLVAHSRIGTEEECLKGICEPVGRGVRIAGGSGADSLYLERVTETYCYAEEKVEKNALSVLALASTLKNGVGIANAFRPIPGKGAFVTKSSGRVVYSLNNRVAADVYTELTNCSSWQDATKAFNSHPFGIVEPVSGYWHVHSPAVIQKDGSLVFFSEIPQGSGVSLLEADPQSRVESTRRAVQRAIADAGYPEKIAAVVFFNCILCHQQAERLQTGRAEIKAVKELVGENVPLIGASTYGETGYTLSGTVGHHNQTTTVWLLGDEPITR
ncbi:FIST signal transduction protein [Methylacidiphilum caldifontis]|nr:FIST N-terminal domain-containing protein [Methylacidiphilum caldifontis]